MTWLETRQVQRGRKDQIAMVGEIELYEVYIIHGD